MNTFGKIFKFTSFGESHSAAIGCVIDGMPSNIIVDYQLIKDDLMRRKSKGRYTTSRTEEDEFKIISGVHEDRTIGSPICVIVENKNIKKSDYIDLPFRPNHADITYFLKYKINFRSGFSGGGRASARESVARVIGGAFAKMLLNQVGIKIAAGIAQIGKVKIAYNQYQFEESRKNEFNILNKNYTKAMLDEVLNAKNNHDSIGGTIALEASVPPTLGEPLYYKLDAILSSAIMSINAVKAVEIGEGISGTTKYGSEFNDEILGLNTYKSNNSGGILGGISNGDKLRLRAYFKPTPSIFKPQNSIDDNFQKVNFTLKGRHDPCVVLRASVIVEAMCALVLADMLLLANSRVNFNTLSLLN